MAQTGLSIRMEGGEEMVLGKEIVGSQIASEDINFNPIAGTNNLHNL